VVDTLADMGKIVIVAALDSTFQGRPFNCITDLVAIAENVTKLTAVCHYCGTDDASFTKRLGTDTALVVIGNSDKYAAICRACRKKERPTFKMHT
jgi:thymidine kinase